MTLEGASETGGSRRPGMVVLRLNHRPGRDHRVTTHVALTARALGAAGMYLHGEDQGVADGIAEVTTRFGGDFFVKSCPQWRKLVKDWSGLSVHLTMYGERLDDVLARLPRDRDLLLIVGSSKVPRETYELADVNVSVGNQPHSEVSAVALFMDRFLGGGDLYPMKKGGNEIVPQKSGKKVLEGPAARFPTQQECRDILTRAGCDPSVIRHSEVVTRLALEMVEAAEGMSEGVTQSEAGGSTQGGVEGTGTVPGSPGASIDKELLQAGAMLHDLGRARTHGVDHIVEGVALGRDMGLHPLVIRIIARHIGSGVEPEEARALGFPQDHYKPESWEEKLVSLADSLIAGDRRASLQQQKDDLIRKELPSQASRLEALYRHVEATLDIDLEVLLKNGGGEVG